MAIMTRFLRLCKADIHGVMDQLEDKGLLLKQHLRDMEEELDRRDARLRSMEGYREQAKCQIERHERELEKLEQDLTLAIQKDKDDIARFVIKKLKPLRSHREELRQHMEGLDKEMAQLRSCVEEQRRLYEQLQLKAASFLQKAEREQWEEAISNVVPVRASSEPSGEEVELELLARKEALKGGTKP